MKEVQKEIADKQGRNIKDIGTLEACSEISSRLRGMDPVVVADISDMFGAGTKGKVEGPLGHSKSYYKSHDSGVEAFAEMTSASIVNKESLLLIKKHFPRSYDIYLEMLRKSA